MATERIFGDLTIVFVWIDFGALCFIHRYPVDAHTCRLIR